MDRIVKSNRVVKSNRIVKSNRVVTTSRNIPTLFEPASLSGLQLQLKANASASNSSWSDFSGLGNNATQATAAQQPIYSATAYNNKPGLTFDGVNDNMFEALDLSGSKTIGVSFKLTATPGASTLYSLIRLKNGSTRTELMVINFSGYKKISFMCDFATSGAASRGIDPVLDTNPHTLIVTWDGISVTSSDSYKVYLDGNPWLVLSSSTINASASSVGSIGGRATNTGFEIYPSKVIYFRTFVYSGVKTPVEIINLHQWLARGFSDTITWTPQVICDGNSLTFGFGTSSTSNSYPQQLQTLLGGAVVWAVYNFGVNGQTTTQMISDFSTQIAPLYNIYRQKNILVVFEAGNEILANLSSTTVLTNLTNYVSLGKAAGFKVIALTVPKRADLTGGKETTRQTVNTSIVSNTIGADYIYDAAAESAFSNTSNTTYYNVDGVHYTDTGYGVIAAGVNTGINYLILR